MSHLYELVGQRLALQHKLEALDFDQETISDTLEGNSTELQEKIESYGFVIRNRCSFTDAIKIEIERLQARYTAEQKRIANIENWLLTNMQGCGITKIECPAFTIAVQANPVAVEVLDEASIPAEYMRTHEPKPPVPAPDKNAIKAVLKAGGVVPGCVLTQKMKLVIK